MRRVFPDQPWQAHGPWNSLVVVAKAMLCLLMLIGHCWAAGTAPVISRLAVDRPQLARPSGSNVYLVHLTFDYFDNEADIATLVVTTTFPEKSVQTSRLDAVVDLKLAGVRGRASYQVAYRSIDRLGTYTYALQLVDAKGHVGKQSVVTVQLRAAGTVLLAVSTMTPTTGRSGDYVTLKGVGFDVSGLDANAVSLGGVAAEVVDVTSDTIIFEVPKGAVSSSPAVANVHGLVYASQAFQIIPSLDIVSTGQLILAPLAQTRLTAVMTGLSDHTVTWYVNGLAGGSPTLGTIDSAGVYTAPAAPPQEGQVEISAVARADTRLRAAMTVGLSRPVPITVPGTVSALTGGTVQGADGRVLVEFAPGALRQAVEIGGLWSEFFPSDAGLQEIAEGDMPVLKIGLKISKPAALVGTATFQALLPMLTSLETEHAILVRQGGKYVDSGVRAQVRENGTTITGLVSRLPAEVLEMVVVRRQQPPPPPPTLSPPQAFGVSAPVDVDIEEGLTLPVLIEGEHFWPDYMRVTAVDPAIGQHLIFGSTVVSADGMQLGFTIRIQPIPTLAQGQQLPVAFQVERLAGDGSVQASVDTDPQDFIINGLPELIVTPDPSSTLFAVEGRQDSNGQWVGRRIDRAVNTSGRYSTLVVDAGAVLGIGRPVSQISADGVTWDVSSLTAFEAAVSRLIGVTDAQRTANTIALFQPENQSVRLDVTGPVRIDGEIYLAGMRGGEHDGTSVLAFTGLHRLGGFASGTLSGGMGGDGGVTQGSTPNDGQRAGNNSDLGLGRGVSGILANTNQIAGFGSRLAEYEVNLTAFVEGAVSIAQGFTNIAEANPLGAIGVAKGVAGIATAKSQGPSTAQLVDGRIVAGQGGHGGERASGISAHLPDDGDLLPGSGGGGGGGGGSSSYEVNLFGVIPVQQVRENGGAGAGGGGAAGALRITTASDLEISETGQINGAGGRGGVGELHGWLGSPGGGGGGGAGGVAKLQGARLSNRGVINLSGGERSGALVGQSGSPPPGAPARRVQVLDGIQHGGFLYYGAPQIAVHSPTVTVVWPTGRARAELTLPFTGIRGIGVMQHFVFGPVAGLLVITDDRRIVWMTSPDYFASNPSITPIGELLDLTSYAPLSGFTPRDVVQSPVAPYHIYVGGVRGTGNVATSEVHTFDIGGNYLGLLFSSTTVESFSGPHIGHLRELDVLSDGRLVSLMTTQSPLESGVFAIDPANGSAALLFSWWDALGSASLKSMSVLRDDTDQFLLNLSYPVEPKLQRRDLTGQETAHVALMTETVSAPGTPGLLRLDGSLPASNAPVMQFDGFDLPGLWYPVGTFTPSTFSAPTIGSFEAPAAHALAMESLVIGRPLGRDITVFCQGAEQGQSAVVWKNSRPLGLTPPADANGACQTSVTLDLGFNTLWVEPNVAGNTHALLKRHLLVIRTGLFGW